MRDRMRLWVSRFRSLSISNQLKLLEIAMMGITAISVIVTIVCAIATFQKDMTISRYSNTINVLSNVQSLEFQSTYLKSINWMENNDLSQWPADRETAIAIQCVLENYKFIAVSTKHGLLERSIVDGYVSKMACQYYMTAQPLLKNFNCLEWWRDIELLCQNNI